MPKEERIKNNYENDITEVEVCSNDFGQFIANIVDIRINDDGSNIYVVCDQDDMYFDLDIKEIKMIKEEKMSKDRKDKGSWIKSVGPLIK